jgi:hypothetical protein
LTRHLRITRRRIPLDRFDEYTRLWNDVRTGATNAGARAWVFEAERSGDRFIEFIEWQAREGDDIAADPNVGPALDALNAVFPVEDSDTWLEAKI